MASPDKLYEAAARAEDLQQLLDHIAWTDTIKPEIEAAIRQFQDLLTARVLGRPVGIVDANNHTEYLSSEQIAGRIDGLKFLLIFMQQILEKGAAAIDKLRDMHVVLQ